MVPTRSRTAKQVSQTKTRLAKEGEMRAPKIIRVAGLAISRVDAAPAQAARQVARTILVVALAGLVWSGVTSSARADANPPIGDTTVFASVPLPPPVTPGA